MADKPKKLGGKADDDVHIEGDFVGRDVIRGGGAGGFDPVKAAMEARAREMEIEAQARAKAIAEGRSVDGGAGQIRISGNLTVGGDLISDDKIVTYQGDHTEIKTFEGSKRVTNNTVQGNQYNVSGSAGGDMVFGDKVSGDKVGGDKVTGDKITAGRDVVMGNQTSTSGLSAQDVAQLFDALYQRVNALPAEERPAVAEAVDTIKAAATAEAVNGTPPDEKAITAAAKSLAVDAPDLLQDAADVALATLENPAKGVLTIIRKIAAKARAPRA